LNLIERALEKLDENKATAFVEPRLKNSENRGASALSRADQMIEDAIQRLRDDDERNAELGIAPSHDSGATEHVAEPSTQAEKRGLAKPLGNANANTKRIDINLDRLRSMGMVTPDASKTPIAEEFRMIKRPLIKNALGQGAAPLKNGNLIMVTSAFPREGKTFCAVNLAISIAMELDHTVLLVDADVARPSVARQLGVTFEAGLMDALLDPTIDLGDVMVRTNIEKLTVLPAGRTHARSTELLASEAMSGLLHELSTRYADRIIVFDSPPLLVTTESRTLAAKMGQIVLVVASESTTHTAVQEALAAVESCEVIGTILNKAKFSQVGEYGYYGY
jgi:receptor protein-tyrosine kinase